jgi:hypothetical protein
MDKFQNRQGHGHRLVGYKKIEFLKKTERALSWLIFS